MKNICILGSTGSIGRQALDVARAHPDKIKISALAAQSSDELLEKQLEEFKPKLAVLADKEAATRLRKRYRGATKILAGPEGLLEAVIQPEVEMVLTALVGFAGLEPTLQAIEQKKDIALANKETLVAAGNLIMPKIKAAGVRLLPVDSEHSAIFQALNGEEVSNIKKILLTASGGPFRGKKAIELARVTKEDCLKHPNWSMGAKITIDSSTLANKGLEVIEAHWLFGLEYDKIQVVVHPQSIIHSMVEYLDGSIIAQLGLPDMKVPIQYAFSYPDRWPADFEKLDFYQLAQLTFAEPDWETFPALKLAFEAGKAGGTAPCVYNAANEAAVTYFLQGKCQYLDIAKAINYALQKQTKIAEPDLPAIIQADQLGRQLVEEFFSLAD